MTLCNPPIPPLTEYAVYQEETLKHGHSYSTGEAEENTRLSGLTTNLRLVSYW